MADLTYELRLGLSNGERISAGTFTVPQGETGPQGPKGDTGAQGPQGVSIVSASVTQVT